jgi:hypothetical protein
MKSGRIPALLSRGLSQLGLRSALYASQLERLFGWLKDDTPTELRRRVQDSLVQLGWDWHEAGSGTRLGADHELYSKVSRSPKLLTAKVLTPHVDVMISA